MERINYQNLTIPELRLLATQRGIELGHQHLNRDELIALLVANDTQRQPITAPIAPGQPTLTATEYAQEAARADQVRYRTYSLRQLQEQVAHRGLAARPEGLTKENLINLLLQDDATKRNELVEMAARAFGVQPTARPITPPRQPAAPVAPIAPQPTRTIARTGTVPSPPASPRQVPRIPLVPAAARIPIVPIPTVVTTAQARPPVQTVVPPVVRPRVVTPPRAVQPIVPPAPVPIPRPQMVVQPVDPLAQSIRQKLQGATYDVYDFEWKRRGAYYVNQDVLTDARQFRRIVQTYQKIELPNGDTMWVMEYLMTRVQPQFIAELATTLGFTQLNATIDVYYNLLWYLNVAQNPLARNLTTAEINYISGLTVEQSLALLGTNYRGPRDKAALIFAMLSGKSAPRPDQVDIPRYQEVATYSPETVWLLAEKLYNLIDEENRIFSVYPPYVQVALQPPSSIEQVIAFVTPANVDELMARYGIVTAPQNVLATPQEKVTYFIKQIAEYDPVFTRQANPQPPPVLTGMNKRQIKNTLAIYTLAEIVDAYEPTGNWTTRRELHNLIHAEARDVGSKWSWRHRHCNNDDTMNIIEGDLHGDINKDNPQDPTLSYGVVGNYRCYQAGELSAAFREDTEDHIFHFYDPDFAKNTIDKITHQQILQEFPTESIRQLRELLQNAPAGYNVRDLLARVQEGLTAATQATTALRRLRAEYDAKSDVEQGLIRLYLAWLFVYGMWMRFWRGPGTPWPVGWVEGGGGAELCQAGRRDEHIFIQNAVRTAITNEYEKAAYPGLRQWIEALPLIDYNFHSGEAKMAHAGATTIKTVLDRIQLGDFCMAHGSDLILKTSYYLIARLLGFATEGEFNQFIDVMLPVLVNIEQQVVANELAAIAAREQAARDRAIREGKRFNLDALRTHEVRNRIEALEARRTALAQPMPRQPPFRPTLVERTGHTDPGLGYRIQFAE